jgi:hypothetical protein
VPDIVNVDIADVAARLPQLENIGTDRGLPTKIDLLIVSAGFEDRAQAIIADLVHTTIGRTIAITYPTNQLDNAGAQRKYADSFAALPLEYARGSVFRDIARLLSGLPCDARIVVDLSAMASYVIYPALAAILSRARDDSRLAIYYAEADSYAPTLDEWETFLRSVQSVTDPLQFGDQYRRTYFQTRGVQDVYESDVFPGANRGSLPTRIAAMPSFSLERMRAMLAYIQSQYGRRDGDTAWYLGDAPDRGKNGWRLQALDRLYGLGNCAVSVSTLQYKEVMCSLHQEWRENSDSCHLLIASCGSKMQHLGSLLFLIAHPECGLVLCEPKEFLADRYSDGIGAKWWCDFGSIGSLRDVLRSLDTLKFQW